MLKMVSCFSSSNIFATSPVFVLSRIPKLAEKLKSFALPGIQVNAIKISDDFNEETLIDDQNNCMKEAEIVVCDADLLAKTYRIMPNLKWAHCTWAGVEQLFKAITEEPPFLVTRHSGDNFSASMGEYVVCHILNCERRFKLCWQAQESKTWIKEEQLENYRTLDELTVAILGIGNMASGIAKFLKARGTTVFGLARTPRPQSVIESLFDRISTNLDDILPECDYLCNALPDTPLTCGMLNNSVLKKCTKKPVFINVGRGSIISENELLSALRSEWISGAVLDVFENEPLPPSSDLWSMSQVTITPHVAASSKPEQIAEEFFKNFSQYVDGHEIQNAVNWHSGY